MRLGLCLLIPGAAPAPGAAITGIVTAKGPALAAATSGGDSYSGLRYKFADRVDYDHLKDFVIYIDQAVADSAPGSAAPVATVTQRNASFEPHVMPIAVGSKIRWPNADDIFHNVFSMSEAKAFDLGLYLDEKVPVITFDQVGQVDVFCSIHSKLHCIILVLPSRFFAMADAHGRYLIRN
jgi:plastocyanin